MHQSFSGEPLAGSGLLDQASFRIDYANKNFYVHANARGQILKVAELSNPNYFNNVWNGFTSGVCYLSITGDSFLNSEAEIVITDIMGEDLTKTEIKDVTAPEIVIDYNEFDINNYPDGVVNCPYKIFGYTCTDDFDMSPTVDIAVYAGYYTNKKISINIENGYFLPKYKTVYTIVYTAYDIMGNTSVKTVDVNVGDSSEYNELSFEVEQDFSDCKAASFLEIKNLIDVNSYEPTFGQLKLKINLINLKEDVLLYDGKLADFEGVMHRLVVMGNQKIVYTIYDYNRSRSIEKNFNVSSNDVPVFDSTIDKIGLPKYLISSNTYKFPTVNYLDLSGDEVVYKKAKLSIFDTKANEITDNLYTVANVDHITVKYYTEENSQVFIEKNIPVYSIMNGVKIDMSKLFLTSDKVTKTLTLENISFLTREDSVIECLQEFLAENFNLDFNVNTEKNAFTELAIKITDARNQDLSVVLNLVKDNGKTKLFINNDYNGLEYAISLDFYGNKNANFELKYEETKNTFTINNVVFKPVKYLNGNSFAGFTSRTLTVSIEMKGVLGESELKFFNISGQPLSKIPQDNIAPNMEIIRQTEKTIFEKGAIYDTPIVISYDVLCGYSNSTISVRQVGGGYLRLEDGRELKDLDASVSYKVILSEYSEYTILMKTLDKNEIDFKQTIIINVLDKEPPEITLSSDFSSKYSLNASVTLPKIIVNDNISYTELEGYIVVINPNDEYEYITSKTYKFTKIGNYKFKFFAYDVAGNLTVIEKNVKVG